MKLRKLILPSSLNSIKKLVDLGIPLARVIRTRELDISHPALTRLLAQYETIDFNCRLRGIQYGKATSITIYKSLFPRWLDDTNDNAQEQPKDWIYTGKFPLGMWEFDG